MSPWQEGDRVAHARGRTSMNARRKLAAALLVVSGIAGTVSTAVKSDTPYTLGISMPFLGNTFMVVQANLLADGAKKIGLKTLPVANADRDAGKQISDFPNLIALVSLGIVVI